MLRTRAASLAAASSLLFAAPADASMFGEENIALAAIALQTANTVTTLGNLVTQAEQSFEVAKLTLQTARDASAVVADFAYLTSNPDDIFDQAQNSFSMSFPEIEAMARDAQAINDNLSSVGDPNARARTVLDLINHSRATSGNAYHAVMAFNSATYGMLDPYLENLNLLKQTSDDASAIRMSTNMSMTANQAAIATAKATANAATVLNAIAATNLEIARIKEQEYLEKQKEEADASIRSSRHLGTSTPDVLMPANDDFNSEAF